MSIRTLTDNGSINSVYIDRGDPSSNDFSTGDFTKDSDFLSKVSSRFFGAKEVFGVKFCGPNFRSSIARYYYCVKEGLYLGKS